MAGNQNSSKLKVAGSNPAGVANSLKYLSVICRCKSSHKTRLGSAREDRKEGVARVTDSDETKLRDSEVALMDAVKVAFDLMMYAGIKPAQIDKLLASLSAQYPAEEMPRAIWVIEQIREFVNNPQRATYRDQRRLLQEKDAAGSA